MEQVDTPAEVPKYSAIASKLIGQIRNGEYRARDLLPSEPELRARQFRELRAATTVMLRSFDSPFASRLQIRKRRTISDSIRVRRSCASSDASSTSAAAFSRVRAPCTRRKAFATR